MQRDPRGDRFVVGGNRFTVASTSLKTARAGGVAATLQRKHAMAVWQATTNRDFTFLRQWVEEVEAGPEYLKDFKHQTAHRDAKLYAELEKAKLLLLAQDRSSKWRRNLQQPKDHLHLSSPSSEFAISQRRDGKGGTRVWAGRDERKAAHFGTAQRFKPVQENSEPGPIAFDMPTLSVPRDIRIGAKDRSDVPANNTFGAHLKLSQLSTEVREEVVSNPWRFITVVAARSDDPNRYHNANRGNQTPTDPNNDDPNNNGHALPDILKTSFLGHRVHHSSRGPDILWKGRFLTVKWLSKKRPPVTAELVAEEALITAKAKSHHLKEKTRDGKLTFHSITEGIRGVVVVLAEDGETKYKFVNPIDRRMNLPTGSQLKVELGYSLGPGAAFDPSVKLGGFRRKEHDNGSMKSKASRIGWVKEIENADEKVGWMNLEKFPKYGEDWTRDQITGKPLNNGSTAGLPTPQTYKPTLSKDLSAGHDKYKRGATGLVSKAPKNMLAHSLGKHRKGLVSGLLGTGGELTSDTTYDPTPPPPSSLLRSRKAKMENARTCLMASSNRVFGKSRPSTSMKSTGRLVKLDRKTRARAEKLFRELDKDSNDGELDAVELIKGMRSMPNFEKLFGEDAIAMEALDVSGDKKLNMEEFVLFFEDKLQAALGSQGENFRQLREFIDTPEFIDGHNFAVTTDLIGDFAVTTDLITLS